MRTSGTGSFYMSGGLVRLRGFFLGRSTWLETDWPVFWIIYEGPAET